MFSTVLSAAMVGIEATRVRVEAHVGGGKPAFSVVGLPDTAVREARERVRAALASTGYSFPSRRVTVNLSPAYIPKVGSAYDLPIALSVLVAAGHLSVGPSSVVALGELALDGTLRPVRGGLSAGLVAAERGVPCLLSPSCAAEACLVPGAEVVAARSLEEVIGVLQGACRGAPLPVLEASPDDFVLDLAEIRGQPTARRAVEVGAAGGHHLLMWGPPGVGKTMLARALPGLLPPLPATAALEVSRVWSAAGRLRLPSQTPPVRRPHHTTSLPGLLGGGSGVPTPGELSLAHRGVLFLDELAEFPRHLLDSLRQPLEDGVVVVSRKGGTCVFPCEVQLVAATNPCGCGFRGDRTRPCSCSSSALDRYHRRLSEPFLDRFDIRVAVPTPDEGTFFGPPPEASSVVRDRIAKARLRQEQRGSLNRGLERRALDSLELTTDAQGLLRRVFGNLAGRGYDRVRRVARTISDLDASEVVSEQHVAEALAFRSMP